MIIRLEITPYEFEQLADAARARGAAPSPYIVDLNHDDNTNGLTSRKAAIAQMLMDMIPLFALKPDTATHDLKEWEDKYAAG